MQQLFVILYICLFCLIIFYLCIGPDLQESDPTVPRPLEERGIVGEEGHLEAETSEAQEEAEPDSGLGESSVEGGEGQSSMSTSFTT